MFVSGGIEVASVIELSEASGRVAAGLFQIHPPTIDTLVTGMSGGERGEEDEEEEEEEEEEEVIKAGNTRRRKDDIPRGQILWTNTRTARDRWNNIETHRRRTTQLLSQNNRPLNSINSFRTAVRFEIAFLSSIS